MAAVAAKIGNTMLFASGDAAGKDYEISCTASVEGGTIITKLMGKMKEIGIREKSENMMKIMHHKSQSSSQFETITRDPAHTSSNAPHTEAQHLCML